MAGSYPGPVLSLILIWHDFFIFIFFKEEAKTECSSNKCQHICEVSPEGAKCRCLPGYLAQQNRTCIGLAVSDLSEIIQSMTTFNL